MDPDQDRQNVHPDLDPNRLTLIVFLKEFLEIGHLKKMSKSMKKHPACKLFDPLIVFLKEFLEKVHFEKSEQKYEKTPSMQTV